VDISADPDRPVVIARVGSEAEATALITALEGYGIEAMPVGGHVSSFRVQIPADIEIVVRATDAVAANKAPTEIRGKTGRS